MARFLDKLADVLDLPKIDDPIQSDAPQKSERQTTTQRGLGRALPGQKSVKKLKDPV